MSVHSKIQIYTFTFSDNPLLTQQDDIAMINMYVHLKFGENWTTNKGDMAKSLFLQFFFVFLSSFFSLNPSISKTIRGTGLNS